MANDTLSFEGRVAVVTGAGAGLGREYALLFGARGAKVVVNDLGGSTSGEGKSSRAADVVVDEIRSKGGIAVANYDSVTEGEKIIQTALDNFGRVDILVNNAGILRDKSFYRITEEDFDIITDVHFKGSFKTTQAAWPIFKKQNYGRIIMTISNSAIYGNFGQANYSAAKLALIGLTNTLAIEGERNNIHCNCIVPTAASRLTKDILPENLYNELKPKLIAPVVAYMCHETNTDNGNIIESAAGWAAKIHFVRGNGAVLRTSLAEDVTPEYVRNAWSKVTDMSNATHIESITEATGSLMDNLNTLEQTDGHNKNSTTYTDTFKFNSKDLILYALGIGATVKDNVDLKFLYENHPEFAGIPTFFILPGLMLQISSGLVGSALKHTELNLSQILHGEQYLEVVDDLPNDGVSKTNGEVVEVIDKKSGAVIITNCNSYDENGNLLIKNQSAVFIVGAGNFGGKSKGSDDVIPVIPPPNRSPDHVVQYKTSVEQAALYRLSGDMNPLHIDPDFAIISGQKVPIMHGLCTLGFSVRAVLQTYANNNSSLFKAVKARFTKPAFPGQTLKISLWRNGQRIHFKTSIAETGLDIITGAYVDLKPVVQRNKTAASSPSLQSDAVFEKIKDRINEDLERAKKINAVFLYHITKNGKPVKKWVIDLKEGSVYEGAAKGAAVDTTLTLSDEDFVNIALGKLNPQVAFMKGKLKITGNIMLTQKLVPLLKTEAKL